MLHYARLDGRSGLYTQSVKLYASLQCIQGMNIGVYS